ncbi:hypothetical protein TMatcc_002165 [Talaromyces marneffei ATCC 18224]|uniref:Ankyrin repeat-containing protein, putative n=1 Tax=Talaromyces marneffei (strain ATCC 18224 / CBS 334.59 / QM 7333) TaxID=441960 RepID=B6QIW2_TALMQ|nr:uncharacterized protein EYB26_006658 [Talaromyces marneffei]EEA23307.1 ankyrin repeat-containing protein, putative [Talaromyces marneffei ATCC 18224]QGA18973.1 hypothetical protein EYB26_006658 [Talaromyces marneffei]
MAEAIGLLTGLIGGCDVILRASTAIVAYISDIKDAPKDIKNLRDEIENLEAIVSAVRGFFQSPKASRQEFVASSPITSIVQQCESFVTELKEKFEVDASKPKALWVLGSKERYRSALQDANRYTGIFQLGLSLSGWGLLSKSSEEAMDEMKGIRKDLQKVIRIIEPIDEMKADVKEWKDHVKLIEGAMEFCKRTTGDTDAVLTVEQVLMRKNEEYLAKIRTREKEGLLNFISEDNFLNKHLDVVKVRHKNTGLWILEKPSFRNWFQTPSDHKSLEGSRIHSTLWCHGAPGAGKTVIFSRMVDYMKQQQSSLDIVVTAVYLSHNNPSMHHVDRILPGLVRQISEALYDGHDNVKSWVRELMLLCKGPPERSLSPNDYIDLLQKLTTTGKTLIVCFDGLDELPENHRRQLLQNIVTMARLPRIKLLLMSRSNFNIGSLPCRELQISARDFDLREFLTFEFNEIHGLMVQNSPVEKANNLHRLVIDRIIATSKGMFLLASLQVRQLETATSIREIEDVLSELPEELEGQYQSYVARIKSGPRAKLAMNALRWVTFAYRPLTPDELVEALAVRYGDSDQDETGFTGIGTIIEACGGLIAFDRNTNDVRLVHETLREHLEKHQVELFKTTHLSILAIIATYLKFKPFGESCSPMTDKHWFELRHILKKYKLAEYCFRHWDYHVKQAGIPALPVALQISETISTSEILLQFVTLLRLLPSPAFEAGQFTPLHVAALWKIVALIPVIMRRSPSTLNKKSSYGFTPLHVASTTGDYCFVEECIKFGADIHAHDNQGRMPIHHAAAFGNSALLPLLLKANGVVSPISGETTKDYHMSPLHVAISNRHLEFAEGLLQHGADPNATIVSTGQTTLHYAYQFCPSAVIPLLDYGAALTASSINGRTCLHWACLAGSISLTMRQVLQDQSAESRDSENRTPLHILSSARQADIDTARWLVKLGSNISSKDKDGMTPLHVALRAQNFELADFLVTKGCEIDTASTDGDMPVLIAARDNHCPESLLMKIACTLSRPGRDTLLHLAVRRQNADEVSGLLKCKLDVNAQDRRGETPLLSAARLHRVKRYSTMGRSRSDIVSLLLSSGADPDAQSQGGLTPIQIAVIRNSSQLLAQMLGSESTTNYGKSDILPNGTSLLHYAAMFSVPCFEILFVHTTKFSPLADHSTLLVDLIYQLQGSESSIIQNEKFGVTTEPPSSLDKGYRIPGGHQSLELEDEPTICQTLLSHCMPCERFVSLCEKICIVASAMPDDQRLEILIDTSVDEWYERITQAASQDAMPDMALTPCQRVARRAYEAMTQPSRGFSDSINIANNAENFTWEDGVSLLNDRKRSSRLDFKNRSRFSLRPVFGEESRIDGRRPTMHGIMFSGRQLKHIDRNRERTNMSLLRR